MNKHKGKPNIILILADDLGYGDLSCLNPESKISTPYMDRLASQGMIFTDAHSNSAVCTPARYGILTGRYCWRTRLKSGVLWGYSQPLIEEGRTTVPSMLLENGYTTACIGKWHLGLGWQLKNGKPDADQNKDVNENDVDFSKPLTQSPNSAGFDYSYIIPASLDMDPYCYIENGSVTGLPMRRIDASERPAFWRNGFCTHEFKHGDCLKEFTSKAVSFIDNHVDSNPDKPFFLYFPLPSPHTPHVPREQFRGKSNAGAYGDFVVETDWSIGRIMENMKRKGIDDNTLLIVTSDNGAHMRDGSFDFEKEFSHRSNYIFRGQKSDAWDGGHRIPFLARWNGKIKPGGQCDDTICLTDILATCAAILDIKLPDVAGEDSCNILPDLTGTAVSPAREAIVAHSIDGKFAIRKGPWKLILCKGSGGWSLKEEDSADNALDFQLYNMDDDPCELDNLAFGRSDIVSELTALLETYKVQGHSRIKSGKSQDK